MPLHATSYLTFQPMLLQWRRQLGKFNDSKIGQLFWVAALVYSIYTGFFWTLVFSFLRIVFLVRRVIGSHGCGVMHLCTPPRLYC